MDNWHQASFEVPSLLIVKGVNWNREEFLCFTCPHLGSSQVAQHAWFGTTATLPACVVMLLWLERQAARGVAVLHLPPPAYPSLLLGDAGCLAGCWQVSNLIWGTAPRSSNKACKLSLLSWPVLFLHLENSFWPVSNSVKHLQSWLVPSPAAHPLELSGSSPFLRAAFLQAGLCP